MHLRNPLKSEDKWVLTEKRVFIVIIILFIVSLIPLFAIATYNHSSADDYSYGLKGHEAWQQTGSVFAVIKAAGDVVMEYYETWQGTFSAIFLMGLQPALFGEQFYFLVPVILILLLLAGTYLFIHVILKKYLGANIYEVFLFAIPIITVSIQLLPSPVEGFYWYNGSVFYTFFYSLQLITFSFALLSFRSKTAAGRWVYGTLAVLFCAIIGGSNYTTALLTCVWTALSTIYLAFRKSSKAIITGGMLLACGFSLFISAMAPGNAVRQGAFPDTPSPFIAIFRSFLYAFRYVLRWTTIPVLLMLLFLLPVMFIIIKRTTYKFQFPLLVLGMSFCVFASSFTPPVYAMNSEGPSRLLNIIFYSYILMFVGNTFYIVGWVYRKWQIHVDSSSRENTEQFIIKGCKSHSILGSILLAGALFVSCRYAPDGKTLTSILAYRDLSTGCAAAYDREVRTRMDIFLDPSISDALVKPIKAKPDVLYYTDLSTAKDKWPNTSVAAFFGKSTVGLDLSDESVD